MSEMIYLKVDTARYQSVFCAHAPVPGDYKEMSSIFADSALVYESKCGGKGGVAGSQPMSTAVHMEPK